MRTMFALALTRWKLLYTVKHHHTTTTISLEIMRKQTKYLPFLFLVGYWMLCLCLYFCCFSCLFFMLLLSFSLAMLLLHLLKRDFHFSFVSNAFGGKNCFLIVYYCNCMAQVFLSTIFTVAEKKAVAHTKRHTKLSVDRNICALCLLTFVHCFCFLSRLFFDWTLAYMRYVI